MLYLKEFSETGVFIDPSRLFYNEGPIYHKALVILDLFYDKEVLTSEKKIPLHPA